MRHPPCQVKVQHIWIFSPLPSIFTQPHPKFSLSHRFRRGKKDNFDDLLDAGSPSSKKATGKAATPKAAEDTPSKGRKKK